MEPLHLKHGGGGSCDSLSLLRPAHSPTISARNVIVCTESPLASMTAPPPLLSTPLSKVQHPPPSVPPPPWISPDLPPPPSPSLQFLGMRHPIFLAGMNVAAGPGPQPLSHTPPSFLIACCAELAAAVSNAGGCGVIGGVGAVVLVSSSEINVS